MFLPFRAFHNTISHHQSLVVKQTVSLSEPGDFHMDSLPLQLDSVGSNCNKLLVSMIFSLAPGRMYIDWPIVL
jgi:hypothetical protein